MLWTHPSYRATLQAAGADGYDALAGLSPTDNFHAKQGRSTGRYQLCSSGATLSVYLKKHRRLPWWQRWLAPLSRFPGPRELAGLQRAASLGIPVPEPILAGADRRHGCLSLLATRDLVGFVPLHEFPLALGRGTADPQPAPGERRLRHALIERLAEITRRMHAARHYHRDLYLCHFFVRVSPGRPDAPELVLIDFGRLICSRRSRWRVKDLAQLLYSSDLPGVTRTDRLRFFRSYLGLRRLDQGARRLLRLVERKSRAYHCHNRRSQPASPGGDFSTGSRWRRRQSRSQSLLQSSAPNKIGMTNPSAIRT